jgi:predicted site-specific integrase-resolvase
MLDREWISTATAANEIDVSTRTIERWIKGGRLENVKIKNMGTEKKAMLRISRNDWDNWKTKVHRVA